MRSLIFDQHVTCSIQKKTTVNCYCFAIEQFVARYTLRRFQSMYVAIFGKLMTTTVSVASTEVLRVAKSLVLNH